MHLQKEGNYVKVRFPTKSPNLCKISGFRAGFNFFVALRGTAVQAIVNYSQVVSNIRQCMYKAIISTFFANLLWYKILHAH